MLYGAITTNADYFYYGVNQYGNFMSAFRADGSFPEDARRGCRAVLYSTVSMSVLSAIAEVGLHRGINLYSRGSNGVTLSDGIRYLLEVKDDNSIIVPYANVNGAMDPSHRDGCPGGPNGQQVRQEWENFFPLWHWILRNPSDPVAIRLVNNLPEESRRFTNADTGNIPYLWTKYPGY